MSVRLRTQFVEQRLCVFEVGGIEAFGEPAVDRREQVVRFGAATLVAAEPVEDHIGALPLGIRLQAEAVETLGGASAPAAADRSCYSLRNSPATSRRRKILPTGDFGISATNTYSRGRL